MSVITKTTYKCSDCKKKWEDLFPKYCVWTDNNADLKKYVYCHTCFYKLKKLLTKKK